MTDIIIEINYMIIIASLIPVLIASYLQSFRWSEALKRTEAKRDINALFRSMMSGNALNNILPKGGEFIKPYIYAKRRNLSYTSVLASVGIDRYYDLIGLIFFLIIILIFNDRLLINIFGNSQVIWLLIAISITAILSMLFMIKFANSAKSHNWLDSITSQLSTKNKAFILNKYEEFADGFKVVNSTGTNFNLLLWTIVTWIFHALNLYLAFFAFDFDIDFNFLDSIVLLIGISVGITVLPIPGGTGVQHYVVKMMMISLFALSSEQAFAFAAVNHASIFLLNLIVGAICLIIERKHLFN